MTMKIEPRMDSSKLLMDIDGSSSSDVVDDGDCAVPGEVDEGAATVVPSVPVETA
jgi:hypothetical protein